MPDKWTRRIGISFSKVPNNKHGSLPLVSWICRPNCEGGLGIRKFLDVNAANLAKLGWKVLKEVDNLWVRVVTAKYLRGKKFLAIRKVGNASRM